MSNKTLAGTRQSLSDKDSEGLKKYISLLTYDNLYRFTWNIDGVVIRNDKNSIVITYKAIESRISSFVFRLLYKESNIDGVFFKKCFLSVESIIHRCNGKNTVLPTELLNIEILNEIISTDIYNTKNFKQIIDITNLFVKIDLKRIENEYFHETTEWKYRGNLIEAYLSDRVLVYDINSNTLTIKVKKDNKVMIQSIYNDKTRELRNKIDETTDSKKNGKIVIYDNLNTSTQKCKQVKKNNKVIIQSIYNDKTCELRDKIDETTDSEKNGKIVIYDNFNVSTKKCKKLNHLLICNEIEIKSASGERKKVFSTYCKSCNINFINRYTFNKFIDWDFFYEIIDFKDIEPAKPTKTADNKTESKKIINVEDFLVRSNINRCVFKEHNLLHINAIVSILTADGMIEKTFDAMYCSECNKYYIFESTYNYLKTLGHICCKIIEYQDLVENCSKFSAWQKKSLLAMYGYNVNKYHSLTPNKRHTILDFLIQNKIMRTYEIISHLEMLIRTRKNMKNMNDAIYKWKEDIDYVQNYNKTNNSVIVKSIYARATKHFLN